MLLSIKEFNLLVELILCKLTDVKKEQYSRRPTIKYKEKGVGPGPILK